MDPVAICPSGAIAAMQPVSVLVVDDQPAVREGLAQLIASAPLALRAVGAASTAAEALSLAARLRPQVVVLDADLAGEDGLALIPLLARSAAVLVLSCHGDSATQARAALMGARGFVEKHAPGAELLGAIRQIATPQMRGEQATAPHGESDPQSAVASSAASRTACA